MFAGKSQNLENLVKKRYVLVVLFCLLFVFSLSITSGRVLYLVAVFAALCAQI